MTPAAQVAATPHVVPIGGDCAPLQETLGPTPFSPLEARGPAVLAETMHGQSTLLEQAQAHLGG